MISVGTALKEHQCVPFVSLYTDCTEENRCSGCKRCFCTKEGRWSCRAVVQCGDQDTNRGLSSSSLDNALDSLMKVIDGKKDRHRSLNPKSHTSTYLENDNDDEDVLEQTEDIEKEVLRLFPRRKRAVNNSVIFKDSEDNGTVKFHHTIDEINEDTLKNNNTEGTIEAKKFDTNDIVKLSRRAGQLNNENSSALHIEYNDHISYNPHETDNKIDSNSNQYQLDKLSYDKVHNIFNNYTNKDKDLSKIVVNELKKGIEYIGDKHSPVMSNITFTPEKDTLTAMALIAGNLLNKLWNIEKDNGEDPIETEILKHEKIADLIELFKEPITMRQAMFLKNALEKISNAMHKNNGGENNTICKNLEKARLETIDQTEQPGSVQRKMINPNDKSTADDAVSKIGDVLKLVKKFETVNVELDQLKDPAAQAVPYAGDEVDNVNQFGTILEKITKLLMPDKKRRKDTVKKIQNLGVRPNKEPIKSMVKELFNIDPDVLNLSPKDELLFSYLNKMRSAPKCLLDVDTKVDPSIKAIGGNILLNLSEFFKVKSIVDLLKLTENKPEVTTTSTTTTISLEEPVTTSRREYKDSQDVPAEAKGLEDTKNRLKDHLRSILEDVAALQQARGAQKQRNYKISDILPCVYKLLQDNSTNNLKAEKEIYKPKDKNEVSENIRKLFHVIKQHSLQQESRKFNEDASSRPKSAVVWERTVKVLDEMNQPPTRRHLELDEPRQFDKLKTMISALNLIRPNDTKKDAAKNIVPPEERLVLFKTLEGDTKNTFDMLKLIQKSLSSNTFSVNQLKELRKFIDKAFTELDITELVLENTNKPTQMRIPPTQMHNKVPEKLIKTNYQDEKLNLRRDQLLNQLIKNRVDTYLKTKESLLSINDRSYKIAQRIRRLLQNGSHSLARQLFKTFINLKPIVKSNDGLSESAIPEPKGTKPRMQLHYSKPGQDGVAPETLASQDYLLKQLLNMMDQESPILR